MPVTLRDLAKALNLSHATISLVLNNRFDVAIPEETRQRVWKMAKEMGYRPNYAARALVKGSTQMVALTAPRLDTAFYHEVIHRLYTLASREGYEVLVRQMRPSEGNESTRPAFWPVDGIVSVDGLLDPDPDMPMPMGIPTVSVGTCCREGGDRFEIDIRPAMSALLHHLRPNERVLFLGWKALQHTHENLWNTYAEAMQSLGFNPSAHFVSHEDLGLARADLAELLGRDFHESIICYEDELALLAVRACRDVGRSCPRDVRVAGIGGARHIDLVEPPLTSIQFPIGELCEAAWHCLLDRMRGSKEPLGRRTYPARLIQRESTRVSSQTKDGLELL